MMMLVEWFNKNIVMYGLIGVSVFGLFLRIITNFYYNYTVKATENMGETKNKMIRRMRAKYDAYHKLKLSVYNVDMFVDKQGYQMRFCGIKLSTWDILCGQVRTIALAATLFLCGWGLHLGCGQDVIIPTMILSLSAVTFFYVVDKIMNEPLKQKMIRANLTDYFENYLKVKYEKEREQPELFEHFKEEYKKIKGQDKQGEKEKQKEGQTELAAKEKKQEKNRKLKMIGGKDNQDELNRRREERLRKEELKKELALKREAEQRKLELARLEEEKRRIEEKKERIAKLKEEEKIRTERIRAELKQKEEKRRAEAKRKEEHLKKDNSRVNEQEGKEKDSMEKAAYDRGHQEFSRERAEREKTSNEIENQSIEVENLTAAAKEMDDLDDLDLTTLTQKLTEEEQQLIEDVLKEFFA